MVVKYQNQSRDVKNTQCTYHVILESVHVTIVAVEAAIFWECVCSLWYPECNGHVPFCHLLPAWLCIVFLHYLINGTIFVHKVIEHKMRDLIFSTTSVRKISHSKKKWVRYYQKCILVSLSSIHYSGLILMKLVLLRYIFEKYSNTKFHKNPFSGSRVVSRGQTGGQTDMTKIVVTCCNLTNTPKNDSHKPTLTYLIHGAESFLRS